MFRDTGQRVVADSLDDLGQVFDPPHFPRWLSLGGEWCGEEDRTVPARKVRRPITE
jgi:hypothetical protein